MLGNLKTFGNKPMGAVSESAELFGHMNTDKSRLYRCSLDVFAAEKCQYRLQSRPNEGLAKPDWSGAPRRIEEVNSALTQLAA
jgi:hypothetical protein